MRQFTLNHTLLTVLIAVTMCAGVHGLVPSVTGTGEPTDGGNGSPLGDGVLETNGDWTADGGTLLQYSDTTIIVNGDLTIVNDTLDLTNVKLVVRGSVYVQGGSFTATGLELIMKTPSGSGVFDVSPGGSLTVVNATFRPADTAMPYTVLLGGPAHLTNVTFNRTGVRTTGDVDWGVKAEGGMATMTECAFHNASGTALLLDAAYAAITDTTFTRCNGSGLVAQNSHLEMEGCAFSEIAGEYALKVNSSSLDVDGCTFTGNGSGMVLAGGCGPDEGPLTPAHDNVSAISGCVFAGVGVKLQGSAITFDKADVSDVDGTGVHVLDVPAGKEAPVRNSKVARCSGEALLLSGEGITAGQNTLKRSGTGISLSMGKGAVLSSNTVEDNGVGALVTGTLALEPGESSLLPFFAGNSLTGNDVGMTLSADGCALSGNDISFSAGAGILMSGAGAAAAFDGGRIHNNSGPGIQALQVAGFTMVGGFVENNGGGGVGTSELLLDCAEPVVLEGTALGGDASYGITAGGSTELRLSGVDFITGPSNNCLLLEDSASAFMSGTALAADRILVAGFGTASSSWSFGVELVGPGDVPVTGANFTALDSAGTMVINGTVNSSAFTRELTVFTVTSSGPDILTPHTFKATHDQYGFRQKEADVTGGAPVRLQLLPKDLHVSSAAFSTERALAGEDFTLELTVANGGDGDVGEFSVTLAAADDGTGTSLGSWKTRVAGLAAGESVKVPFGPFSFPAPGIVRFTARADPGGRYVDVNRGNNELVSYFPVNGRPLAGLAAGAESVLTGESVTFNASGSSDPDGIGSYRFVFGDGQSSGWVDTQEVTHVYSDDGNYTARVWVQDVYGAKCLSAADAAVAVVNRAPSATFTVSPGGGTIDTWFGFKPSASDADGSVVRYSWDFGDGVVSSTPAPSHRFDDDEDFTVSLTVFDDDGYGSQPFTAVVSVSNTLPVISVTGSALDGIIISGEQVTFDATSTSDDDDAFGELQFGWEFGDGNTSAGAHVNYTYGVPGIFLVTLTVYDDDSDPENADTYVTYTFQVIVRAGPEEEEEPEEKDDEKEDGGEEEENLGWVRDMYLMIIIAAVAIVGVVGLVLGLFDRRPAKLTMPLHCEHCGAYFPPEDLKGEDRCPKCSLVVSETAATVIELADRPAAGAGGQK